MTIERTVLILTWALIIVLLALFVPREKRRDAALMFLAGQALYWSISHLFVEFGLSENPVREFAKASGSNFTFSYALYPTFNALYGLYFPRNQRLGVRIAYIVLFPALFAPFFYWIDKHTLLIHFLKAPWYAGFAVILICSYAVKVYCDWFFHRVRKREAS